MVADLKVGHYTKSSDEEFVFLFYDIVAGRRGGP